MSSNNSKLVKVKNSFFNPLEHWINAIDITKPGHFVNEKSTHLLDLFDQNGYDLTELEKLYAHYNDTEYFNHREHRFSIKKEWYRQEPKPIEGPVLNHCYLFERKGYTGGALKQLKEWANGNDTTMAVPLFYKLISLRSKWGIDFSMDYVGTDGTFGSEDSMIACELFHYEWDSFSFEEADAARIRLEKVIEETDWNKAAKELLRRKEEWIHLPFFEQSDWKCAFFGLPSEKFKMVAWTP